MLRQSTRLPLRRALHTSQFTEGSSGRLVKGAAVAAAATVASGVTMSLLRDQAIIWNDAPETTSTRRPLSSSKQRHAAEPEFSSKAKAEPSTSAPESSSKPDGPSASSAPPDGGSPSEEGEGEGEGGGAFDPVTGKINWDCPCLGGMAYGPCGQEFREAFSCFVYSEVEPKGMDCVEKFKGMQTCFREHPDVYGDEIMRDEEDDAEAEKEAEKEVSAATAGTAETLTEGKTLTEASRTQRSQKARGESQTLSSTP